MKSLKYLLFVFIAFVAVNGYSQTGLIEETLIQSNNLTREGQNKIDQLSSSPFLKKMYAVRLGSIKKLQKEGAITFQIPGRKGQITAYGKHVEHQDDNNYTWHGDILDKNASIIGTISYIVEKGSCYGTIKLEGKLFHIEDLGLGKNGRDRL